MSVAVGAILGRLASFVAMLAAYGGLIAVGEWLAGLGLSRLPTFDFWGVESVRFVNGWIPLDTLIGGLSALYASRLAMASLRVGFGRGGKV